MPSEVKVLKRKKYDFHTIISYFSLTSEFVKYQKNHKNISFNRAARAFLVKNKVAYKKPCFEFGSGESPDCYFIRLAKYKWIDD